jgi:hypothetical protein
MSKKLGVCPECECEDSIYSASDIVLTPVQIFEDETGNLRVETIKDSSVSSCQSQKQFLCDNCAHWFNNPKLV